MPPLGKTRDGARTRRALPAALEDFAAFEGRVTRLWLYEFFPARYFACFDLQ